MTAIVGVLNRQEKQYLSLRFLVRMIQRRYDPKKDKDYYAFLKRIGYAENMDYHNSQIRAIANTL